MHHKPSLRCLVHTQGNDTRLSNKNKLSGDWTGALCVHVLHLHPLGSVCVRVSAASGRPPVCVFLPLGATGLGFFFPRERREEQTYLPPAVGLPTGASPRATGLLRLRARQMAAVLLFYFGLVLVKASDLPLLGAAATAHRTLRWGREEQRRGERERRAGHFSPLMTVVVKSNLLEKDEHRTQKIMCSNFKF